MHSLNVILNYTESQFKRHNIEKDYQDIYKFPELERIGNKIIVTYRQKLMYLQFHLNYDKTRLISGSFGVYPLSIHDIDKYVKDSELDLYGYKNDKVLKDTSPLIRGKIKEISMDMNLVATQENFENLLYYIGLLAMEIYTYRETYLFKQVGTFVNQDEDTTIISIEGNRIKFSKKLPTIPKGIQVFKKPEPYIEITVPSESKITLVNNAFSLGILKKNIDKYGYNYLVKLSKHSEGVKNLELDKIGIYDKSIFRLIFRHAKEVVKYKHLFPNGIGYINFEKSIPYIVVQEICNDEFVILQRFQGVLFKLIFKSKPYIYLDDIEIESMEGKLFSHKKGGFNSLTHFNKIPPTIIEDAYNINIIKYLGDEFFPREIQEVVIRLFLVLNLTLIGDNSIKNL